MLGQTNLVTEEEIRLWIRDNQPQKNLLLQDLEFSTEEIEIAKRACVAFWNEVPPFGVPIRMELTPCKYHLIIGTVSHLLQIAANRYRRNALEMNSSGLSINDQAKHNDYIQESTRLWAIFTAWVKENKRAVNMAQCWGHA